MTKSPTTIKCPECGHQFDISDVLYHQVEHDVKQQFEAQLKLERDKYRIESEKLRLQGEQMEKDRAELARLRFATLERLDESAIKIRAALKLISAASPKAEPPLRTTPSTRSTRR